MQSREDDDWESEALFRVGSGGAAYVTCFSDVFLLELKKNLKKLLDTKGVNDLTIWIYFNNGILMERIVAIDFDWVEL